MKIKKLFKQVHPTIQDEILRNVSGTQKNFFQFIAPFLSLVFAVIAILTVIKSTEIGFGFIILSFAIKFAHDLSMASKRCRRDVASAFFLLCVVEKCPNKFTGRFVESMLGQKSKEFEKTCLENSDEKAKDLYINFVTETLDAYNHWENDIDRSSEYYLSKYIGEHQWKSFSGFTGNIYH